MRLKASSPMARHDFEQTESSHSLALLHDAEVAVINANSASEGVEYSVELLLRACQM